MKDELTQAGLKIAPPAGVVIAERIFNMTLNDWVAVATLCYVILQTFFLLKDRLKKRRQERKARQ